MDGTKWLFGSGVVWTEKTSCLDGKEVEVHSRVAGKIYGYQCD